MNKRSWMIVLACALLLVMYVPQQGYAISDAEIDRQLELIQKREAEAARKQREAERMKKDIAARKAQETSSMLELRKQIQEQGNKLQQLQLKIDDTENQLRQRGRELEEAERRVADRAGLLKSRVRLMYTNGAVTYLEVLLESTSFSDFLHRFQALKSIVAKDKEILEANKRDREEAARLKSEVETKLQQIQTLYAEAEKTKLELMAKEKDKEVVIASLTSQEEQIEELSEEQEQYLKELAAQKSKLWAEKNKNKAKVVFSGGKLNWPLPGRTTISSGFVQRVNPVTKKKENHKGIDIPAPAGTEIHAAAAGTVIIAQWVNGYGNTVVIDHGNGLQTWYGHARSLAAKEGDQVKAGDVISYVGSTGQSTGNHLHFEVRVNGEPVNPLSYVSK